MFENEIQRRDPAYMNFINAIIRALDKLTPSTNWKVYGGYDGELYGVQSGEIQISISHHAKNGRPAYWHFWPSLTPDLGPHKPYNERFTDANISAAKSTDKIAAEVLRRVITPAAPLILKTLNNKSAHDAQQVRSTAAADVLGSAWPFARRNDQEGIIFTLSSNYGTRPEVEARISHDNAGNPEIKLTIEKLTTEEAKSVLMFLLPYRKTDPE